MNIILCIGQHIKHLCKVTQWHFQFYLKLKFHKIQNIRRDIGGMKAPDRIISDCIRVYTILSVYVLNNYHCNQKRPCVVD